MSSLEPKRRALLRWTAGYSRPDFAADLLAGATTAVLLVPQAMAYAMLAGLPPITGLYASLAPPLVYAVLGTSRRLAVGPVALDSLLTAAALAPLAAGDVATYVAAAAALAILAGAFQALTGALRLGFVVNFLSLPVLRGFTSAAAILIIASQLGPLLGLRLPTSAGMWPLFVALGEQLRAVHLPTLALGLGAVVLLVALGKFRGKALLLVVLATLAGHLFALDARGLALLGPVPSGLPVPAWPAVDRELLVSLAPAAALIALISFMEAFSSGLAVARRGEVVEPDQELLALGFSNIAAGLARGYPIAGGLSRTAVNAQAGARSPLAGVVTAAIVALTLALFAPLLATLPRAVLSAIIVVAVARLVDLAFVRELRRTRPRELVPLAITFAATLALGVGLGLAFGVGASLLLFVLRTTRPHTAVLGRLPGTQVYRNVLRFPDAETVPGVVIVRLDAPLYFANATYLIDELRRQISAQSARAVVIDAGGVHDIDVSALANLRDFLGELRQHGIELHVADLKGPVRDVLARSGFTAELGPDRFSFTAHEAIQRASGGQAPAPDPRATQNWP
ncbi:SulP family inorganic anion transporter [Nannocystis punicea]|uniref:Sulfate permease n=1 Tax=Nannocystis punicea TaxID=2995304 RepID=A0ABY7GZH5_9BACT|nr:sulfate permease [Nannocystis poenicansa]WAS92414.1 sulfate permease [Nannocystis poenicansa]